MGGREEGGREEGCLDQGGESERRERTRKGIKSKEGKAKVGESMHKGKYEVEKVYRRRGKGKVYIKKKNEGEIMRKGKVYKMRRKGKVSGRGRYTAEEEGIGKYIKGE